MEPVVHVDLTPDQVTKPFLSHSVWQAYLDCPALFYFQYILKLPERRSAALAVGTAWDQALTEYARQKMETKEPTPNDIADVFCRNYDKEFVGVEWTDTEIWTPDQRKKLVKEYGEEIPVSIRMDAERKTSDFWRAWGVSNARDYVEKIGPTVRPLYVQKWFFIDFGDSVPFGFKGVIDRVDEDGMVVDNKTSKTRWSASDMRFDLQCVGYALAYRLLERKNERGIRYDVLVKTKNQTFDERFQQLSMGIEPHRMSLLLSEITATFRNIQQGNLYRRAHKFSGKCSYCSFADLCWEPHQQWAKVPSKTEINDWLAEEPENAGHLDRWIKAVSSSPRLIDLEAAGAELRDAIVTNPLILTFWY